MQSTIGTEKLTSNPTEIKVEGSTKVTGIPFNENVFTLKTTESFKSDEALRLLASNKRRQKIELNR
ncbi:MAG: hypothetical protein IPP48_17295 [Chitinophagaceae bacterium]|nr:hypothetical protein [Chitinophagaceae bacterium]